MLTTIRISDEQPRRNRRLDMLFRVHRIVCILSVLLIALCSLRCVASYTCALQDMKKFTGLGFSYSLLYYLKENSFLVTVGQFLLILSEFIFYIRLYMRAEVNKAFRYSLTSLYIIMALHIAAWFHANSIVQGYPPPVLTSEWAIHYRTTTNITILPTIAYSVLYSFRVLNLRKKTNA